MYSRLYEDLKKSSSYEIIEVDHLSITLPPNQLLTEQNIPFEELIGFHHESDRSSNVSIDTDAPGGCVIFTLMKSEIRPIVVINSDPFHTDEELSNDEDIVCLCKYVTLLHELGHIHDFENEINFKINPYSIDVDLAEAHAEIFTLNKLIENKRSTKSTYDETILSIALNQHIDRVINGLENTLFSEKTKDKILQSYTLSDLMKYKVEFE